MISTGVCPAPAGIGRRINRVVMPTPCLPRARGDRPLFLVHARTGLMSAPRPRGSAVRRRKGLRLLVVCPAPAGIGLGGGFAVEHVLRLPRARGDRPSCLVTARTCSTSAPRPRGSAISQNGISSSVGVCPAPAGIGPACRSRADVALVCPAPAGIGLPMSAPCFPKRRLPRARGDRPSTATAEAEPGQSAPRPRGSAVHATIDGPEKGVCPAPAGIGSTTSSE